MENRHWTRAKNGKKRISEGVFHFFSIFVPFLGHFFAPVQLGAVFHLVFLFFPPFMVFGHFPCQPGMIPSPEPFPEPYQNPS